MTTFGGEKVVFQREFSNRLYALPGYFISRWLVELPTQVGYALRLTLQLSHPVCSHAAHLQMAR